MIGLGLNINQLVGRTTAPTESPLQQAMIAAWDMQDEAARLAVRSIGEVGPEVIDQNGWPGSVEIYPGVRGRSFIAGTLEQRFEATSPLFQSPAGKTIRVWFRLDRSKLVSAGSTVPLMNVTAGTATLGGAAGDAFGVRVNVTGNPGRIDVSARNAADSGFSRVIIDSLVEADHEKLTRLEIFFDDIASLLRVWAHIPETGNSYYGQVAIDGFNTSSASFIFAGRPGLSTSNYFGGEIGPLAVFDEPISEELREFDVIPRLTATPPPTADYDLFLLVGQSNMIGRDIYDAGLHGAHDPNALQFSSGRIRPTSEGVLMDLNHPDNGRLDEEPSLGLAMSFGREYMQGKPANRRALFIPCARGGTSFSRGDWSKGDQRYEFAVETANAAIEATGRPLKAILWHQGESDAADSESHLYQTKLDQMIADLRSDIDGAGSVPFLLGGLAPDRITNAEYVAVQAIIEDTPNRVANTIYVASDDLTVFDGTHFDAESLLALGERYKNAF